MKRVRTDQKSPGVSVRVLPRQAAEGRILLELQLQIIQEDVENSITQNGKSIPGYSSRRTQSHVELKPDEPVVLGGLIQTRRSPEDAKLTSETEFIVVTTTSIVPPDATKLPTD
jgi:type II secretory pathway component GspD/PulD (secretin)